MMSFLYLIEVLMTGRGTFSRSYQSALLDYVQGSGETGLESAYALGRQGISDGLLQFLRVHQNCVNTILESTEAPDERMRLLLACEEFLIEALSPFEMVSRGYFALLNSKRGNSDH